MTERIRTRIQEAGISFHHRVAGLSLWNGLRSSVICEKPLHLCIERNQLRWLEHLVRMSPEPMGRCFRHAQPGGGPWEDPGHAGETMSPGLSGNDLGCLTEPVEVTEEVWASL